MHLMLECEKYNEPLKKNLEEIINEIINDDNEARNGKLLDAVPALSAVSLHSFMVIFNITASLPSRHAKEIVNSIQGLEKYSI